MSESRVKKSDAAVEAAAIAVYGGEYADLWADEEPKVKASYLEDARLALEAAAPYLMADAWDEGERTGRSRAMRHMSDEPNLPLVASNPYRATK